MKFWRFRTKNNKSAYCCWKNKWVSYVKVSVHLWRPLNEKSINIVLKDSKILRYFTHYKW